MLFCPVIFFSVMRMKNSYDLLSVLPTYTYTYIENLHLYLHRKFRRAVSEKFDQKIGTGILYIKNIYSKPVTNAMSNVFF